MRDNSRVTQPGFGKTLIVGLGKTGLSCARYLTTRGLKVAVVDSRDNPPGL
jgi:UDP-N-acetylmuramoylalanine--D-glutamate ligase